MRCWDLPNTCHDGVSIALQAILHSLYIDLASGNVDIQTFGVFWQQFRLYFMKVLLIEELLLMFVMFQVFSLITRVVPMLSIKYPFKMCPLRLATNFQIPRFQIIKKFTYLPTFNLTLCIKITKLYLINAIIRILQQVFQSSIPT